VGRHFERQTSLALLRRAWPGWLASGRGRHTLSAGALLIERQTQKFAPILNHQFVGHELRENLPHVSIMGVTVEYPQERGEGLDGITPPVDFCR
jgi:hypothetical protein